MTIHQQSPNHQKPTTTSPSTTHLKPHLKWLLYATSFFAGFIILTLEILGFRLFAPYFGYSVYVSGSLITLVLIAISAGYFFGGKIADSKPSITTPYLLILSAGLYLILMTAGYSWILKQCSGLSPVWGTITGSIILFGAPMVLLSMVTPIIIKQLLINQSFFSNETGGLSGSIIGTISAVSTFGSIVGSVAATFYLIPEFGSRATLILCDAIALLLGLCVLVPRRLIYLSVLPVALVLLIEPSQPSANLGELVYQKESLYNLVKVFKQSDRYYLQLNDIKNIQSSYAIDLKSGNPLTGTYVDLMSAAQTLAAGNDCLILGLGGGTAAKQLGLCHPAARIDAVEIDPAVAHVAERYFGVHEQSAPVTIHVADARPFLARSQKKWDVIQIDVYHGGTYMPFYLATREFFALVKDHLNPQGVLVMNVLCESRRKATEELYGAIGNTIASVFDSVFVVRTSQMRVNALFFAVRDQRSLTDVQNVLKADTSRYMKATGVAEHLALNLHAYLPVKNLKPFTDDRAPVERLTYALMQEWEKSGE